MKNKLAALFLITLLFAILWVTPAMADEDLGDLDITMEIVGAGIENSKEITNTIELPFRIKEKEELQYREQEQVGMDTGDNGETSELLGSIENPSDNVPEQETVEDSVEAATQSGLDSARQEKAEAAPKAH